MLQSLVQIQYNICIHPLQLTVMHKHRAVQMPFIVVMLYCVWNNDTVKSIYMFNTDAFFSLNTVHPPLFSTLTAEPIEDLLDLMKRIDPPTNLWSTKPSSVYNFISYLLRPMSLASLYWVSLLFDLPWLIFGCSLILLFLMHLFCVYVASVVFPLPL